MRILLCLLSEQHVPNIVSVHHFKPDRLMLIETEQMARKKVAKHFLSALNFGDLDYSERCDVESLGAEDDLGAIRKTLQLAYGKYPGAQWVANLTGGTKPMSIAAYEFFKALGGTLVYTNISRPARLINIDTGKIEDCSYQPSIKAFLAGYGFESRKTDGKLAAAERRAGPWIQSARLLAGCEHECLRLTNEERSRARRKGIELSVERFNFPCEELRRFWLNDGSTRKLDKYEAEFLTGGWLEVFMWDVLRHHQAGLGIWDVRLGLEVGRCGDQLGNDFDVAFMHNHGLSMIECKSGAQEHDEGGDVLYKVEAVKRQFGAIRVRSCLATTGRNVLDDDGKLKKSLKTRSDIYQCRILVGDQIRELAANPDSLESVSKLVFE